MLSSQPAAAIDGGKKETDVTKNKKMQNGQVTLENLRDCRPGQGQCLLAMFLKDTSQAQSRRV